MKQKLIAVMLLVSMMTLSVGTASAASVQTLPAEPGEVSSAPTETGSPSGESDPAEGSDHASVDPGKSEDPADATPTESSDPDDTQNPDDTQDPDNTQDPDDTQDPDNTQDPDETDPEEPEEPPTPRCTVTFTYRGATLAEVPLYEGDTLDTAQIPTEADGKSIISWSMGGTRVTVLPADFTADTTIEAWTAPALTTDSHPVYINGNGNGSFSPNNSLSRAEAAAMLMKLIDRSASGIFRTDYPDIDVNQWYANAVTAAASYGIYNGFKDGTMRPEAPMDRASFVAMLANLFPAASANLPFTDTPSDTWYAAALSTAVANGWVSGYKDGTFRPDALITRAEAVSILNHVLGRGSLSAATKDTMTQYNIHPFYDVNPSDWFYNAVMEAATSHSYSVSVGQETWTDWAYSPVLLQGLHSAGSCYVYYDANGQYLPLTPGIQTIDGAEYLVSSDGTVAKVSAGVRWVDNCYYLFNERSQVVRLSQGLHTIGGAVYYANAQGQIPYLAEGFQYLNGNWYYVNASNQVVQYPEGIYYLCGAYYYANAQSQFPSLPSGVQELCGKLVYVNSNSSIAANFKYNQLYFGSDCAYTTGDKQLDGMIENLLAACTNSSQTQEEKLRAAYVYIRDYNANTNRYRGLAHQPFGSTSWVNSYAKNFILSDMKGNCYSFAGTFLLCARRLGFQAYPIAGREGPNNADHAWVMIDWSDGNSYMFDPELEWGVRYGRYGTARAVNLYQRTLNVNSTFRYVIPSGWRNS